MALAILSTLHWMNWRIRLNGGIKRVTLRLKAIKDPNYKSSMKNRDLAQVTISIISLLTFRLFPKLTLRRRRVILSI